MKTSSNQTPLIFLAQAGVIGGMYAALCLAFAPISYGAVQFRVAEVLTVLPVFLPASIPGLTVGCLIANLFSSAAGAWDWLLGSLATLLAAWLTYALRNVRFCKLPILSTLPPVIVNAVIIGAECAVVGGNGFSWPLFWLCAAQVALGQAVMCIGGGLLLAAVFQRTKLSERLTNRF